MTELSVDLNNLEILAQVQPNSTNNTALYTVPARTKVIITSIMIANSNAASTYSIYVDQAGAANASTTALFSATPIAANSSHLVEFERGIPLKATGKIAAVAGVANQITFTVTGIKVEAGAA